MLALPLLALLLAAPPPDQPRAEALLASPRPIDKAWGAYLTGRLNLTPLIPQLTAELAHLRPTAEDSDSRSLSFVLLDALIELRAPADFGLLKPWVDNYRDESLILLLLNAKANEQALLGIRAGLRRQSQWVAVTNALVKQRAPGLAARLLAEVNARYSFFLQDSPNTAIRGEVPGGGGSFYRDVSFPAGFPPAGRYRIVLFAGPGDRLLAPGPTNAYFSRTIVPTDSGIGWGNNTEPLDIQPQLVAYLAALTHGSDQRAWQTLAPSTMVDWSGENAFRKQAARLLDRQSQEILELAGLLVKQGLLTSQECAELEIPIQPVIEDYRRRNHQPVPPIPVRRVSLAAAHP